MLLWLDKMAAETILYLYSLAWGFSLFMSITSVLLNKDKLYFNPWLGDTISLSLIFFFISCCWFFFWLFFALIQTSSNWIGDEDLISGHLFFLALATLFIGAPVEFVAVIYYIGQDSQYTVLFIKTVANFLISIVLLFFFYYCLTIKKKKKF